jgi:hypothetical protein
MQCALMTMKQLAETTAAEDADFWGDHRGTIRSNSVSHNDVKHRIIVKVQFPVRIMLSASCLDLWTLALDRPQIDPTDLADAIERESLREPLDFRTRLLIRDSLEALGQFWGRERLDQWLNESPRRQVLDLIFNEELGPPGFSLLIHGIMETTRSQTVLQFLRELGEAIKAPTTIVVSGASSLILQELLARKTEDIDVVDELPVQIRSEHDLMNELAKRYRLRLAHFPSHYLPAGWELRVRRLGTYGQLDVQLVDSCDIFLSNLFSYREKDRDDLRVLSGGLQKQMLIRRLAETTAALRNESSLNTNAQKNWYILFGEALPAQI